MKSPFLIKTADIIRKFFYVFLDISGILLGVFLMALGWWIISGREVGKATGAVILGLGVCAFLIHTGHYYSWKLTRWIFGGDDYFLMRKKEPPADSKNF